MLNIINASKEFAGHKVLKELNLTIAKNSITGLAGPSGCGKSTLLRAIQGFEKLDSGMIDCQGKAGFMFQDFQLFPHMNVVENLIYAPKLLLKKEDTEARALGLLAKLGLAAKIKSMPGELSGGQKQRVALARSLMMQPDILLCDEPTSGLDVATIGEVVELLKSIQAMGLTMVIASHDLDFLAQIANRIVLLKDGQIAADMDVASEADVIGKLKDFYS